VAPLSWVDPGVGQHWDGQHLHLQPNHIMDWPNNMDHLGVMFPQSFTCGSVAYLGLCQ